MNLDPLPSQASWRHVGAREGYEVAWPLRVGTTCRLRGATTGVEDGAGWSVTYDVEAGPDWRTRTALVRVLGRDGAGELLLERDADDRWSVDGLHRPELDGVPDVDLEASVLTNTLPLHRLDLRRGTPVRVEAAFVRLDLRVHRLVQTYELLDRTGDRVSVAYTAPGLGVAHVLGLDTHGLVLDYPDLAVRDC